MSTKRREYEYGRIVSVDIVPLGDNLAADASSGATSITVEDACDFDEDGGLLLLAGVVYAYTTWTEDDSTGVGTLTGLNPVLAANAFEGNEVAVYDPMYATAASDKVAQVELVGDDGNVDTLEAALALHLVDKIDEGVRGLNGEQVKLELEGDEWVIVDIFGLAGAAAGGASGAKWEADDTYTLTAADITAGTATFPLTYQPIDESLMAVLGIPQPPTEYTIDYAGQTVTWPLDGWEETGDVIWVHYEYRVGVRNLLSIPIGAVWNYATGLGSSTTYAQPAFDDSAWSEGPSPFGRGANWTPYDPKTGPLSALSNVWNRLWVRTGGGDLTITAPAGVDDEAWVYLDGALVVHWVLVGGPFTITVPCSPGNHLVAVYGLDTATPDMFIAIAVTEEP